MERTLSIKNVALAAIGLIIGAYYTDSLLTAVPADWYTGWGFWDGAFAVFVIGLAFGAPIGATAIWFGQVFSSSTAVGALLALGCHYRPTSHTIVMIIVASLGLGLGRFSVSRSVKSQPNRSRSTP